MLPPPVPADIHKDDKRSHDLNDGKNNIFRTVMHELADIKKVGCDTAHQLSDFLVIIKGKGQLLVMCKDLRTHIVFDSGSHDMSVITDVKFAVTVHCDKYYHSHRNVSCLMQDLLRLTVDQVVGHIPHDQRDDEGQPLLRGLQRTYRSRRPAYKAYNK